MKKIAIIFAIISLLTACGSRPYSKHPESEPSVQASKRVTNFTTYQGEAYSFSYPSSWERNEDIGIGDNIEHVVSFAFPDPNDSKYNILAQAFISPTDRLVDVKSASDALIESFKTNIENFKKTGYTEKQYKNYIGGIFTGKFESNGEEFTMVQYAIPTEKYIFYLNITYFQPLYEKYGIEQTKQIIDSVELHLGQEQNRARSNESIADRMVEVVPVFTNKELTPASYEFLDRTKQLFPADSQESIDEVKRLLNPKVTTRHLDKNINDYLDTFVKIQGTVLKIDEMVLDDNTITIAVIYDKYNNVIYIWYPGTAKDLLKDDQALVVGVPTVNFSYNNTAGGITYATFIAAAVLKEVK